MLLPRVGILDRLLKASNLNLKLHIQDEKSYTSNFSFAFPTGLEGCMEWVAFYLKGKGTCY